MTRSEKRKIVIPVNLVECNPAFAGHAVYIWVNIPRELLADIFVIREEFKYSEKQVREVKPGITPIEEIKQLTRKIQNQNAKMTAIYSQIWSQGPEEHHWSVEEVSNILTDPKFRELAAFLVDKTYTLITKYCGRKLLCNLERLN